MTEADAKTLLRRMFDAGIAAAQPALCLPPHLPEPPRGRTIVIGAGKASAAMAQALERHWDGPIDGLVVTRYGYAQPCERIKIVEAAHPLPDEAGARAARDMARLVDGLSADDLVIALISGGGSALLAAPAPGVTLADKQTIGAALLKSGATISEINCVRRHLSALKGGRLGALCAPARLVTLLISDVPGDDPLDIASGPTVADPTTCADALDVLARYHVEAPEAVGKLLRSGAGESVKPGDPRLAGAQVRMIATPHKALEAAAGVARAAGYQPVILSDRVEGEAREVAKVFAALALRMRRAERAVPAALRPAVRRRNHGDGARKRPRRPQCRIPAVARPRPDGAPGVTALAGDTDGVDGAEEIAGATIAPDTLSRARAQGLDPRASLDDNDGHGFFQALGDSVVTGPTLTNVNDFRAILIEGNMRNGRDPILKGAPLLGGALAATAGALLPGTPEAGKATKRRDLQPLGICFEGWPYPGPVAFLPLEMGGEPVRMAYMDFAPEGAANAVTKSPAILLLHGKNFDSSYWAGPIAFLRRAGFRVVVPDQIGFNKSSKPICAYTLEALAANTLALADALGLEKFALLGHSTGGMLAMRFASLYPDRVSQLAAGRPDRPDRLSPLCPAAKACETLEAAERAITPGSLSRLRLALFRQTVARRLRALCRLAHAHGALRRFSAFFARRRR